ncbi:hypothetical protein F7725_024262 [Dissostichus mawsoni]|uniref:Uncharacterized protein n=1 Tax=Dissostichus mawsoni TaxID=36200 RepID=A0A7J5XZN0_DISMA|nr:hypothetical protein F7725_024262 [Dissostichus mawsoni]
MCEGSVDCALHQDDFCLLEQPQGGGMVQLFHVSKPKPLQIVAQPSVADTLPSSCDWHRTLPSDIPLKREMVLDVAVFDSILKDWMVPTKSTTSGPGVVLYNYQQGLLHCRSEPHQLVQGPLCVSSNIAEDPLPEEQFAAMDPYSLQLGSLDQNTGLHQLNHYMQSALQQDGLTEENLY